MYFLYIKKLNNKKQVFIRLWCTSHTVLCGTLTLTLVQFLYTDHSLCPAGEGEPPLL